MMYETNVNCGPLKEYLGLLMKQNMVEKRNIGRHRAAYSISQRGIMVLEHFRKLKHDVPILGENANSTSDISI